MVRALYLAALIALPVPAFSMTFNGQSIPSKTAAFTNLDALIQQCTPKSHWDIVKRVIKVESGGHPYAIGVNQKGFKSLFPKHPSLAKLQVAELVSRGLNIDIGLMQINSQHFKSGRIFARRGYTVEDAVDPCINLKMGAYIISDAFRRNDGNILATLSEYNTGSPTRGLINGYVEKYGIN